MQHQGALRKYGARRRWQGTDMSDPKKPNNARLGLIIALVAVFFFALVFIKRLWM
jgi:hypothetical protein